MKRIIGIGVAIVCTAMTATVSADVQVELVALSAPSAADEAGTLPTSESDFPVGATVFVEMWAQTTSASGLTQVTADIAFDNAALFATAITHTALFNVFTNGAIDNGAGVVDDLSGSVPPSGCSPPVGSTPGWARVAIVPFDILGPGTLTLQSLESGNIIYVVAECGTFDPPPVSYGAVEITVCQAGDATCDGVDDDCDGDFDEDFVPTGSTCGVGACAGNMGTLTCNGGVLEDSCDPFGGAAADDATCDDFDDDCDGENDEDFDGGPTMCGVGACAAMGNVACQGGTPVDNCMPGTPAADDATCDGVDDDCDGDTDEDFTATPTTCGVGACAASGMLMCMGGAPVDDCVPGTPAADDATCDGIDDDCDDEVDEDFAGGGTTCGVGACEASGVESCVDGAVIDDCTPGEPAADDATCDGVDDDCDGDVDEDAIDCEPGDCMAIVDCADLDENGVRDDGCVWWECAAGNCQGTDVVFGDMGGQFGVCPPDGTADGNDRFAALNCFANVDPNSPPPATFPCEDAAPTAYNVDTGGQFGSCNPDGVCDGNDAFAALNAFGNTTSCACPLDGGPAPIITPRRVDTTAIELLSDRPRIRPGQTVEVTVWLAEDVTDLRGYQLHVDVLSGKTGTLSVVDMAIMPHPDHVFGREAFWDAYNLETWQLVAGLDTPGIPARAGGYLATLTLQASKDAHGVFLVTLAHDADDSSARTYLFPTAAHGYVDIVDVTPARIEVRTRTRR